MVTAKTDMAADYDRAREVKSFDEIKAGVKGLVHAGVTQIPRIFYSPPGGLQISVFAGDQTKFDIPVINLDGMLEDSGGRQEIVEKVQEASETWRFFQIVNHGIPASVMEGMKDGVRSFHEQDTEVNKQFYTRYLTEPLVYHSNFELYIVHLQQTRETLSLSFMAPSTKARRLA